MRVYLNFKAVRGPYGGANSFLRALVHALRKEGVTFVYDPDGRFDVALLNALTNDIDVAFVRRIAERGIPIVHRKVGYRASGSADMRAFDPDGVVHGDRLQLDFSPYLAHTVFQSEYSRDVFLAGGFEGDHTVIHNGVDEHIFNQRAGLRGAPRTTWTKGSPLRIVVSTWSADPLKGFTEYEAIDTQLVGRDDVSVTVVGRLPDAVRFRAIRREGPYARRRLARSLKARHVLLQLALWETCSNALLEGIACGLPPIYIDSGSNRELANPYGVEYRGDFAAAVDEMRERYIDLQESTRSHPYRISIAAPRYLEILESVRH